MGKVKVLDQNKKPVVRDDFLRILRKVTRAVRKDKPKKDDRDRLHRNWLP